MGLVRLFWFLESEITVGRAAPWAYSTSVLVHPEQKHMDCKRSTFSAIARVRLPIGLYMFDSGGARLPC